jgi:cyclic pyranopterin phosphate synthase
MKDSFGRTLEYLRVSITDRCNLRCVYCMPEEGVSPAEHGQIASYEELLRIIGVMTGLGIKYLKVSGGEPLVRKGAAEFLARAKKIAGLSQVTLTTNGTLLQAALPDLAKAGIDGINVSLDTLRPDRYATLTRRGELSRALSGIDAVYAGGIRPLKINTVLLEGFNDDEIAPLAALARDRELSVRFIELMPIGMGRDFRPVSGKRVLEVLTAVYGTPMLSGIKLGNGPAVYYRFPGFAGTVGLIDALSHSFCSGCNRLRLTSRGQLRLCLQYDDGCDLLPSPARGVLGRGAPGPHTGRRGQENPRATIFWTPGNPRSEP